MVNMVATYSLIKIIMLCAYLAPHSTTGRLQALFWQSFLCSPIITSGSSALEHWLTPFQIYLKDNNCILTDVGDRLGIFWEEKTRVPYTFDDNKKAYIKAKSFAIAPGEQLEFGRELDQYTLPISAYLDTSKRIFFFNLENRYTVKWNSDTCYKSLCVIIIFTQYCLKFLCEERQINEWQK